MHESMETTRHDIHLRDIQGGELVVSYTHMVQGFSYQGVLHVSSRLPIECLALFDGGVVDVSDLSDEEREWLTFESGERSNEIDFEGFQT